MRVLSISKGNVEIARAHLLRPILTIGRAPSCDVVLRAPQVRPIHFLLEWVGAGTFDPTQALWSVVDISRSTAEDSGEGIILSEKPEMFGDFIFQMIEDSLESAPEIGGRIRENLETATGAKMGELLELVQIRADSGAIEQVLHMEPVRKLRRARPLKRIPQFQIQWEPKNSAEVLKVITQEMPGARVSVWGQQMTNPGSAMLGRRDLIQVFWEGRIFYLRLVDRIRAPKVSRRAPGDPLLRTIAFWVLLFVATLSLLVRFTGTAPEEVKPEPPRIARIEIPKKEEAPPPAEKKVEPPPAPSKKPEPPKPITEKAKPIPKEKSDLQLTDKKSKATPTQAAAPRFDSPKDTKPKPGLNSPAKPTDVNSIGILGALKKGGKKGPGVRADQVTNDGVVTEAISGQNDAPVLVNNPPAGTLGAGNTGGNVDGGPGLQGASTTLRGAGKYDPKSTGAIARKGGAAGFKLGSGLEDGTGSGAGKTLGGGGAGTEEGDGFSVDGGLDRETVRRVIRSYASQIRTCYERALLTQSKLEGRITYLWTISPEGSVGNASKVSSSVKSSSLELCVLEVIKGMVFPKAANGMPTKVKYPFVFQPIR